MAETAYQGLEERKDDRLRRIGQAPPDPMSTMVQGAYQGEKAKALRAELEGYFPTDPNDPSRSFRSKQQVITAYLDDKYPGLNQEHRRRAMSALGVGDEQDPGDFNRGRGFWSSTSRGLEAGVNMLAALPDGVEAFYGYLADDPQSLLNGLRGIEGHVNENQMIYDFEFQGRPGDAGKLHKFAFDAVASAPAMGAGMLAGAAMGKAAGVVISAKWLAGLLGYGAADALLEGGFSFIDVVSDPVIRKKVEAKLERKRTNADVNQISQLVGNELVKNAKDAAGATAISQFLLPTNWLAKGMPGKLGKIGGGLEDFRPVPGGKPIRTIVTNFTKAAGKEFAEEGLQSGIAQTARNTVEARLDAGDEGMTGFMKNLGEGMRRVDPGMMAYEGLLGATMGGAISTVGTYMPGGSRKEYWEGGTNYKGEGEIRQFVRDAADNGEMGKIELDTMLMQDADDTRMVEIINDELKNISKGKQPTGGAYLSKEDKKARQKWADEFSLGRGKFHTKGKPAMTKDDYGDSSKLSTEELIEDKEVGIFYAWAKASIGKANETPENRILVEIIDKNPNIEYESLIKVIGKWKDIMGQAPQAAQTKEPGDTVKTYAYNEFENVQKAKNMIDKFQKAGRDVSGLTIEQLRDGRARIPQLKGSEDGGSIMMPPKIQGATPTTVDSKVRQPEEGETIEKVTIPSAGTAQATTTATTQAKPAKKQPTKTPPKDTVSYEEPSLSNDSLPWVDTSASKTQREKETGQKQTAEGEIQNRLKFLSSQAGSAAGVNAAMKDKQSKASVKMPGTNVTWEQMRDRIKTVANVMLLQPGRPQYDYTGVGTNTTGKAVKSPLLTRAERDQIVDQLATEFGLANLEPAFPTPETVPVAETDALDQVDPDAEVEGPEAKVPASYNPWAARRDGRLDNTVVDNPLEFIKSRWKFNDDPTKNNAAASAFLMNVKKGKGGEALTVADISRFAMGMNITPIEDRAGLKPGAKDITPIDPEDAIADVTNYINGREDGAKSKIIQQFQQMDKTARDNLTNEYLSNISEVFRGMESVSKLNVNGAKAAIRMLIGSPAARENYGHDPNASAEAQQEQKDFRMDYLQDTIETGVAEKLGELKEREVEPPTVATDEQGAPMTDTEGALIISKTARLGEQVVMAQRGQAREYDETRDVGVYEEAKRKSWIGKAKRWQYIGDAPDGGHVFRQLQMDGGSPVPNKEVTRTGQTFKGDDVGTFVTISTTSPDRKVANEARRIWNFLTMDESEAAFRSDKSIMIYREGGFGAWVDGTPLTAEQEKEQKEFGEKLRSIESDRASLEKDLTAKKTERDKAANKLKELEEKGEAVSADRDRVKTLDAEVESLVSAFDTAEKTKAAFLDTVPEGTTPIKNAPVPPEVREKKYLTADGKAKREIKAQMRANKRLFQEIKNANNNLDSPDVAAPLESFKENFLKSVGYKKGDVSFPGIISNEKGTWLSMSVNMHNEALFNVTDVLYRMGMVPETAMPIENGYNFMLRNMKPDDPIVKADPDKDYTKNKPEIPEADIEYAKRLYEGLVNRNRSKTSLGGGQLVTTEQQGLIPENITVDVSKTGESELTIPAGNPLQTLINASNKPTESSIYKDAADVMDELQLPPKLKLIIGEQKVGKSDVGVGYGDIVNQESLMEIVRTNPDLFDVKVGDKGMRQRLFNTILESQRESGFFDNGDDAYRVADIWMTVQLINNPKVNEKILQRFEKALDKKKIPYSPIADIIRNVAKTYVALRNMPEVDMKSEEKGIVDGLSQILEQEFRKETWEDLRDSPVRISKKGERQPGEGKEIGRVDVDDTAADAGQMMLDEEVYGTAAPSDIRRAMVDAIEGTEVFSKAQKLEQETGRDAGWASPKDQRDYVRTSLPGDKRGETALDFLMEAVVNNTSIPTESGVYSDKNPNWKNFLMRFLLENEGEKGMPRIMAVEKVTPDPGKMGDPTTGVLIPDRFAMTEGDRIELLDQYYTDPDSIPVTTGSLYYPLWSKDRTRFKNLARFIADQYFKDTDQPAYAAPEVMHGIVDGQGNPKADPVITKEDVWNRFGFEDENGNWISRFSNNDGSKPAKDSLLTTRGSEKGEFWSINTWLDGNYTSTTSFDMDAELAINQSSLNGGKDNDGTAQQKAAFKDLIREGIVQHIEAQIKSGDLDGAKTSLQKAEKILRKDKQFKPLSKKLEEAGVGKGEQAIAAPKKKSKSGPPLR